MQVKKLTRQIDSFSLGQSEPFIQITTDPDIVQHLLQFERLKTPGLLQSGNDCRLLIFTLRGLSDQTSGQHLFVKCHKNFLIVEVIEDSDLKRRGENHNEWEL